MLGKRTRTSSLDIDYALYLYFLGLSIRGDSKTMYFILKIKRGHVAIWIWIQKLLSKGKRISEFTID
jgi:putative transposase